MQEESKRPYEAYFRSKSPLLNRYVDIREENRARAVNSAMEMFWKWKQREKGLSKLGNVHDCVIVTDPYDEVRYDKDTFRCTDQQNKLLPTDVRERLIAESGNDLMLDPREIGSVKRTKRRRRQGFGHFIAPNIKQMPDGKLFYRQILVPQKSHDGVIMVKRKHKDILLDARDLNAALREVRALELDLESNKHIAIFRKSRQLRGDAEARRVRREKKAKQKHPLHIKKDGPESWIELSEELAKSPPQKIIRTVALLGPIELARAREQLANVMKGNKK